MTEVVLSDGALALRPWAETDAPGLVEALDGDEEITRWLDQVPQPYTLEDGLKYIRGSGEDAFAIVDDERIVGSIAVRWNESRDVGEIGYWLRADARGGGLTTRALVLVAGWALEQGAARVQLRAAVENAASRRVAEKAGFRFEGVLRSAYFNARLGRRVDWALYSLLPGEPE
ncbi:MAG: GNAT family N-acetyltransferase [Gaiellaceae bacterium]